MRFSRKLVLLVAIPAVVVGALLAAGTLVFADTQPPAPPPPPQARPAPRFDHLAGPGILAAVAEATHLAAAQLRAELAAGEKLLDIITANGATPGQVADIVLQQATDKLAAQVKAGKLTQTQADEITAKLREGLLQALASARPTPKLAPPTPRRAPPALGKRPPLDHGKLGGFIADTAKLLGLTPAEVMQELRAGKTLSDVLAAHGKSQADLKAAILATAKVRFDAAVTAGKLTQDQADKALARMSAAVDRALSHAANPLANRPAHPPFSTRPHSAPGAVSQ